MAAAAERQRRVDCRKPPRGSMHDANSYKAAPRSLCLDNAVPELELDQLQLRRALLSYNADSAHEDRRAAAAQAAQARAAQLAQAAATSDGLQCALKLPPGLPLRPPPGLESSMPPFPFPNKAHPLDAAPSRKAPASWPLRQRKLHAKVEEEAAEAPPALPSLMMAAHQAAVAASRPAEPHVKITPIYENDVLSRTRAEWSIDHVQAKLRTSCGFPLVSPIFSAHNLPPLRFMFAPGQLWAATRGRPQQPATTQGPAKPTRRGSETATPFGALKLKAGSPEAGAIVTLYLTIGSLRLGPLTFDFTERAVQGAELLEDWVPRVEADNDRLVLGVEFSTAEPQTD